MRSLPFFVLALLAFMAMLFEHREVALAAVLSAALVACFLLACDP